MINMELICQNINFAAMIGMAEILVIVGVVVVAGGVVVKQLSEVSSSVWGSEVAISSVVFSEKNRTSNPEISQLTRLNTQTIKIVITRRIFFFMINLYHSILYLHLFRNP